jgi:uncharacterized protein DUF3501
MRPIGLDDIIGRDRYGEARETIRRRVIAHKRPRRVAVGDRLSLVFEDRATVWYQTQEMLWVERVTDLDAIREELEVYNQLLPGEGDLAATLLIELREQERIREEFRRLVGLDRHLALLVGERRIPAVFEDGRQTEEKISAVQYVRFPLDGAAREGLAAGAPLAIVVDHPNYVATATLDDAARTAIVGSFVDPRVADADLRRVRDGAP